jgi:hypothetical protein
VPTANRIGVEHDQVNDRARCDRAARRCVYFAPLLLPLHGISHGGMPDFTSSSSSRCNLTSAIASVPGTSGVVSVVHHANELDDLGGGLAVAQHVLISDVHGFGAIVSLAA